MPKYQSDVATGKKAVPQPFDASVLTVAVDLTLPSVALAANDLLELLDIPPKCNWWQWTWWRPSWTATRLPHWLSRWA
jgi:hypothetical protein